MSWRLDLVSAYRLRIRCVSDLGKMNPFIPRRHPMRLLLCLVPPKSKMWSAPARVTRCRSFPTAPVLHLKDRSARSTAEFASIFRRWTRCWKFTPRIWMSSYSQVSLESSWIPICVIVVFSFLSILARMPRSVAWRPAGHPVRMLFVMAPCVRMCSP